MQAKTICFFCIRAMWQIFAVTLVMLAVLVSLVKYSLPYANDHRVEIERLIHEQFDVSVSIGSISASWEGNGPALVLENLTFVDNQSAPIALSIAKTSLQLNLLESLKNWQLRSNYFVLDGFSAQVDVPKLAEANNSNDSNFEQQALIESLFLGETGHFSIRSSQLNLKMKSGLQHTLLLNDLTWQNDLNSHKGEGEVAIPGLQQGHFSARLSLSGETLRELAGQVYLQAEHVDIAEWLTEYLATQEKHISTELNGELWLSLNQGKVEQVTLNTLPSKMQWREQGEAHVLEIEQGKIKLVPDDAQWQLNSAEFKFSADGEPFSPVKFQAKFSEFDKQIWFEDISLGLLREFALLARADWAKELDATDISGSVQGKITLSAQHDYPQIWLHIEALKWNSFDGIPGMENARVELNWQNNAGVVSLFSENARLDTGSTFRKSLAYEQLNAEIQIYQQASEWQLSSGNIWFNNRDLTVAAEMTLRMSEQPELDLYAEVMGGNAHTAGDYFPQTVMSKTLIDYLNRGLVAGKHLSSRVLLSGPLANFPFEQGEGHFEVLSDIVDAEFLFAPDWPTITNADAELHFVNERMDIYAKSGSLINQKLSVPVVITLPNLNHADNLYVDIKHTTQAQSLKGFFQHTPLKDPLVNVLDVVQASGDVTGGIKLDIDLHTLGVRAEGRVELDDTDVFLAQPGLQLSQVNGVVQFVDDRIELKQTQANWLGMPMLIDVLGDGDKNHYGVDIKTSLQAQADKLLVYADGLLDGYLDGDSELNTHIKLDFTEQGFNYLAKFNSDLYGVNSYFPAPYNKSSEQSWLLSGEVQGDDISNLITANIADKLFFSGILGNDSGQISQAQLSIGSSNQSLAGKGFQVNIVQDDVILDPWLDFIDRLINLPKAQESASTILPPLALIRGQFEQIRVANMPFNDVEMRLFASPDGMTARINAKEARISALLPPSGSSRPIKIDSDYLRINFVETDADVDKREDDLTWLTRVPAIEFNCNDCKVQSYQLDKVTISLFGDGTQLQIPELVVDKNEHVLRGKGHWQNGKSYFDGIMNSKDIGELFDEFDLTSTIKDSKANVAYQLEWQGAPYEFDTQSLKGEVNWELGEGHLAEISDQGARVFSLLSLDSLIRKLKLDFRDVFSKGFFYNQMKGSVQLDKGIAYTKDTKLDGVPADLSIQGYANLNTQEINYDLSVAPQVTSSLPVIVAWMVNPVSGLAALALDKVIHSARVISEIKFKVTGTMSEPVVQEIDRKSREVEIPQAAQNQPPESEPVKAPETKPNVVPVTG